MRTGSRTRVAAALATAVILALPGLQAGTAHADPGDIGYEDQSWSGTGTPAGTKRAESVMWFNDGSWWADMWDTVSQDFHIFRLDTVTQRWVDSGTPIDTRSSTHADALWDGQHLYVASHKYVSDESAAVSGYPSYLSRYSYDPLSRSYSLDAGFPETINDERSETLVIEKDSTGTLWATWQQNNQIYLNRTTNGDRSWGTPFKLPASGADVTVDDNSALVAFGGNHVGVMWSNQTSANDGMYFAVHDDGQPAGAWSTSRTAIQGSNTADDHMNLKSVQADGGTVYAAVKTSFTTSSAPLVMLLVRDPLGNWTNYPVARVSDCPNRPIIVIDTENRVLHSFATYPAPPDYTCSSSGGAIYEKTSAMDAISFPTGRGDPVMVDADSPYVHNVSSSKQNVDSTTGIALLATNDHTFRYWHSFAPITPAGPATAPTAGFSASPTSGTAPLSVAFTDTSAGRPTAWSWDFGDGGTSTAQFPTHVYEAAGSYTVTVTVTNAVGSDTLQRVDYIAVQPPPPDFSVGVAPSSAKVVRGGTTSATVTVSPANGFAGDVALSITGLPSGVTGSFSANPLGVAGTGASTSTLTLKASSTAKIGSSTPRISASGAGVTHTTSLNLQVKRK